MWIPREAENGAAPEHSLLSGVEVDIFFLSSRKVVKLEWLLLEL
jgi:hypothetical protein